MKHTHKLIYNKLKEFDAPRTFTNLELYNYLEQHIPDMTKKKFINWLETAQTYNLVKKIKHGLFMNKATPISVSFAEAAYKIRANSIVSLYTVLSDANILNNYTSDVYSIIPISDESRPNTGTIKAESVNYHFFGIKKDVLDAGDDKDKFVPGVDYARHTPEAAIVYSMYLHGTPRAAYPMLDTQIDVDNFDQDKVLRLAKEIGLYDKTKEFLNNAIKRQELDDDYTHWSPH